MAIEGPVLPLLSTSDDLDIKAKLAKFLPECRLACDDNDEHANYTDTESE